MIEKIKAFFAKKQVIVVEGVIIALASAGLLIGGVNASEIAKIPALVLGVLTAITAVVTLIKGFFSK